MARLQKLSKRAQHKADVEARKDQPFVKRRKQRRNPLPFPEEFFALAGEHEREGVLLTRMSRRPPVFKCETLDDKGNNITVAMSKMTKPNRGWLVRMPAGEAHAFRTQRDALKFIGGLQVEVVEDHMKDGLGNPIRPGGTMANATDEQLGAAPIKETDDGLTEPTT
jgi:hypothetical protein